MGDLDLRIFGTKWLFTTKAIQGPLMAWHVRYGGHNSARSRADTPSQIIYKLETLLLIG